MKCNTDTLKRLFLIQKTSDDDKFVFLAEFLVGTHEYWIYFDYLAWFDPSLTLFTLVWPLCGLIWPQIALKSGSWQNFDSKHMHIGHISITLARFDPNLTVLTQVWPFDDLIWPQKSWIWIFDKISIHNICKLDIFRLLGQIWP